MSFSAISHFMAVAQLALGLAAGYVIASLIESFMHQHVSDAPLKSVQAWMRFPRLSWYFVRTRYSHHVVHHMRTFRKDHVTQFRSEEEQRVLDAELLERGAHGRIIMQSRYAVKLHGSGALVFIAPLLPAIPVMGLLAGTWATLGTCLALSFPPLLSNFIHPYLHMPHQKALAEAPPVTSWLLRTWYFRAMVRNHFMHHRYVASNFNLLLGGDLLRGRYRKPSQKDLSDMRALGLPIH